MSTTKGFDDNAPNISYEMVASYDDEAKIDDDMSVESSKPSSNSDSIGNRSEESDIDYDGVNVDDDADEDENDDFRDSYLPKLNANMRTSIIEKYHKDLLPVTNEQIEALSNVVRDENGTIVDAYHKTLPFVTKYEKTRILGERARQIEAGAIPLVEVEEELIDSYLIAVREYEQKKIPFIIKRPLPTGECEYWRLQDLEL